MHFYFMLINILMILLITEIYSSSYSNCSYDNGNITEFLNDTNSQEKCFSLSYSFGNEKCCFYNSTKRCINKVDSNSTETTQVDITQDIPITNSDVIPSDGGADNILLRNAQENDNDLKCPEENKLSVPNNCGMAGLYQPKQNATCNGISLVQGYCCYVEMHKGNDEKTYACIRTKQLNKDIKKPSDQIVAYVKKNGGDGITIDSVECGQFKLKFYWIQIFILSIIYIF